MRTILKKFCGDNENYFSLVVLNEDRKPSDFRYGLAYMHKNRLCWTDGIKKLPNKEYSIRRLQRLLWEAKLNEIFPGNTLHSDVKTQKPEKLYTCDEAYEIFR